MKSYREQLKEREEYLTFMYNEDNIRACDRCPENCGAKHMTEAILPCGQYHCWVALHCKGEK